MKFRNNCISAVRISHNGSSISFSGPQSPASKSPYTPHVNNVKVALSNLSTNNQQTSSHIQAYQENLKKLNQKFAFYSQAMEHNQKTNEMLLSYTKNEA